MATTIKLKNGSGAPLAGDLVQGEPALDLTNKRLYTEDSGGTVIEVGTNPSTLTVDTTTLVVDAANNRVGVGTASPSNMLHLSSSDPTIRLQDTDATGYCLINAASNSRIQIKADEGNNDANTTIEFHVDGSEAMRIDSSGNVMVGQTAAYTGTGTTITAEGNLSNATASGVASSLNLAGIIGVSNGFQITTNTSNQHEYTFLNGGSVAAKIDTSGNVGIGTASPGATFDVKGSARIERDGSSTLLQFTDTGVSSRWIGLVDGTSRFAIYGTNGSTEEFVIDSSGNVGIGTTSPNASLHISQNPPVLALGSTGSSDPRLDFYDQGTTTVGASIFLDQSEDILCLLRTASGNATDGIRIDSSGNVGIGVTPENSSGTWRNLQFGGGNLAFRNSGANDAMVGTGYLFKTDNSEVYKNAEAVSRLFFDNSTMIFQQAGSGTAGTSISWSEAMRIDSSGKVFIGKTSDNDNTAGHTLHSSGLVVHTRDSSFAAIFNRTTDDGDIVQFKQDGTTVGSIGNFFSGLEIQNGAGYGLLIISADTGVPRVLPRLNYGIADNVMDLGDSGSRYDDIYATNGTIQTSDRNEKQDIEELSDAEQRVAVAAKGLLRKFRWKSAVRTKSHDARIHFGIIAQDLQAAFEAEGLDAGDYGMFTHSTWTDEETGEERSRMGVRYSELLAFIIAAI